MSANEIVQLIAQIGFPIVCCIFMWIYITQCQKETTEAINNNTKLLEKLVEKIDKE